MKMRIGVVLVIVLLFPCVFLSAEELVGNEVTIFFTGFVRGNYGPCGCSAGPTGGVSRRVGYANEFEKKKPGFTVHVDAGNYLQPPGPRSDLINRLMLDSFAEVPLSVLNLGIEDLYWWPNLSKAGSDETRIISTNLISEDPELSQPSKYAIVEVSPESTSLQRSIKIGFLGLADPARLKPNSKFRAIDPFVAISEIKEEVMRKADFLVVLADLPRKSREIPEDSIFRKLAEAHSEIAAILVTERRYRLYRPVKINSAVILSSVERGRYLGQLTLEFDHSASIRKFDSQFIELKEGMPEVEAIRVKQNWITDQLP
jgi:2',3'-cyclic-nucleotide 2'-phosphodiesterase (5'-nucleotidase family)